MSDKINNMVNEKNWNHYQKSKDSWANAGSKKFHSGYKTAKGKRL